MLSYAAEPSGHASGISSSTPLICSCPSIGAASDAAEIAEKANSTTSRVASRLRLTIMYDTSRICLEALPNLMYSKQATEIS